MEILEELFGTWGNELWTWVVLPVLAVLGIYFTVRSGVVQLRLLPAMFKTLTDKALVNEDGSRKSISSFQAFTVSAASRVGVGNVAGVATAIAVGGPGAVFWMWTMAFVGGASSFVESTLAQLYKVRTKDGYRGGPAYYMERGLKKRWMGIIFAVILIICFPFAFSSLQANTISQSVAGAFGAEAVTPIFGWTVGLVLALLTALVVFGGIRRIAHVTEALVPAMALLYVLLGLVIVGMNLERVPDVLGAIFGEAFNFQSAIGGGLGTVIMQGVKRGMFSNEAGLGSAPNAGATASVTHPVKQGLVQTLGVYFDTFLVCSITAFIILCTVENPVGASQGIELTQTAITSQLGSWASIMLAVIIFMLAFSSIIGNYYYGETNIGFITDHETVLMMYRTLATAAVFLGSIASAGLIWNLADGIMGLMALTNLIAIGLLSGVAFRLLKHYTAQSRQGVDPVFTADDMPDLDGVECWSPEDVSNHEVSVPTRR